MTSPEGSAGLQQTARAAKLPSHPSLPAHLLIIAYGNPLRRDDGAGLLLAEKLARQWQMRGVAVRTITVQQLVPELAAQVAMNETSAVLFVDAAANFPSWEIQVHSLCDGKGRLTLGHYCDPALLLAMADGLYRHRPPAWLITVPGVDFGHGTGVSGSVRRLIDDSTGMIYTMLSELQQESRTSRIG